MELLKIRDVKPIDVHDRLTEVRKTADKITEGIQGCIKNNPFDKYADYSYIFAHKRSADIPGQPDRILWQNRLTKPKAQTNSMLFKVYKVAMDALHIKWIIPPREQWDCYKKGNLFEEEIVSQSIYDFENNREWLERREDDDLSDERIDAIYKEISKEARAKKSSLEDSSFL